MSESTELEEESEEAFAQERTRAVRADYEEALDRTFFSLSGGVMRMGPASRTANRFDGLLAMMMGHPTASGYSRDVDRNLDFLHTSLQLDMLERMARGYEKKEQDSGRKI